MRIKYFFFGEVEDKYEAISGDETEGQVLEVGRCKVEIG